ncbi:MAG: agmatinase [Lysobacterales bacterium]|jgi:agmatinase
MADKLPQFLGVPTGQAGPQPARCRVLPVPYGRTVSYEGGTERGPQAILQASTQVELYDRSVDREAYLDYGVETLPAFEALGEDAGAFVARLTEYAENLHDPERLLVGLGGEHTVTIGLARGLRRASKRPVTLVQIDAHADLRDHYDGNPYSHACIARRLLDDGVDKIVLLGVRSVCPEEVELARRDPRIHVHWADEIHEDGGSGYLESLAEQVKGDDVYLTIDVDGLDPGVIPATGTPEPGGLSWRQAIAIIRKTTQSARVTGFDITELAPRPGLHAADFAAAKLTYLSMNMIAASRGWLR